MALVDCGLDDRVVSALVRNNVHHIDAVFVTHWDEDRWGGVPDVLDRFSVGTIAVAADALEGAPADVMNRPGVTYRQVALGDTVDIGAFRARVLWPFDTVDGEGNEDSLVLLLSSMLRKARACACSSLVMPSSTKSASLYRKWAISMCSSWDITAQKFPSTQTCWKRLSPSSIASAGEGNRYGHPSDTCIDAVRDAGGAFACTIDQGDITVLPTVTGFAMRCQRP